MRSLGWTLSGTVSLCLLGVGMEARAVLPPPSWGWSTGMGAAEGDDPPGKALEVVFRGRPGSDGADGRKGAAGATGSRGSTGTTGASGRLGRGRPGPGGRGGQGGRGGTGHAGGQGTDGGSGSVGGDGPDLTILVRLGAGGTPNLRVRVVAGTDTRDFQLDPRNEILTVRTEGGRGGRGGRGGPGGDGGEGGAGGSGGSGGSGSPSGSRGSDGFRGMRGLSGPSGRDGKDGRNGHGGRIIVRVSPEAAPHLFVLRLENPGGPSPEIQVVADPSL